MNSISGQEVVKLREAAGLTQIEAAFLLKISRSSWQKMEMGIRKMSVGEQDYFKKQVALLMLCESLEKSIFEQAKIGLSVASIQDQAAFFEKIENICKKRQKEIAKNKGKLYTYKQERKRE